MNSRVWLGRFYGVLAVTGLLATGATALYLSPRAAGFCFLGVILLGSGFKLTELIVGTLTKTRSANASAIVIIFSFKLFWWLMVFWLAKHAKGADALGFASGLGAFLVALLAQGLLSAGMPKLSSHNKDS